MHQAFGMNQIWDDSKVQPEITQRTHGCTCDVGCGPGSIWVGAAGNPRPGLRPAGRRAFVVQAAAELPPPIQQWQLARLQRNQFGPAHLTHLIGIGLIGNVRGS